MSCGSSPRGEFLTRQLRPLEGRLHRAVQLAAACGMAVIRPIVTGGAFQFELLGPGQFFPTRYGADGSIMAGYIADFEDADGKTYIRLETFDCDGQALRLSNRPTSPRGRCWAGRCPFRRSHAGQSLRRIFCSGT